MTANRSELAKKYFIQTPEKPSFTKAYMQMALGGLLLLIAFIVLVSADEKAVFFCPGLLGAGGVLAGYLAYSKINTAYKKAYEAAEPKPTDQQMDAWLQKDRQQLIDESFTKLDLMDDNVINPKEPLVVVGPVSPTRVAVGKDGTLRFSDYSIVIIYLSNYHLAAYSCSWDFVNAKVKAEATQEYHYADIVSVSTMTSNSDFVVTTMDDKKHPVASQQEFSLAVASGEKIRVVVSFPQMEGILKESKFLPSGAEKAISTLRAMLREKKGGV